MTIAARSLPSSLNAIACALDQPMCLTADEADGCTSLITWFCRAIEVSSADHPLRHEALRSYWHLQGNGTIWYRDPTERLEITADEHSIVISFFRERAFGWHDLGRLVMDEMQPTCYHAIATGDMPLPRIFYLRRRAGRICMAEEIIGTVSEPEARHLASLQITRQGRIILTWGSDEVRERIRDDPIMITDLLRIDAAVLGGYLSRHDPVVHDLRRYANTDETKVNIS